MLVDLLQTSNSSVAIREGLTKHISKLQHLKDEIIGIIGSDVSSSEFGHDLDNLIQPLKTWERDLTSNQGQLSELEKLNKRTQLSELARQVNDIYMSVIQNPSLANHNRITMIQALKEFESILSDSQTPWFCHHTHERPALKGGDIAACSKHREFRTDLSALSDAFKADSNERKPVTCCIRCEAENNSFASRLNEDLKCAGIETSFEDDSLPTLLTNYIDSIGSDYKSDFAIIIGSIQVNKNIRGIRGTSLSDQTRHLGTRQNRQPDRMIRIILNGTPIEALPTLFADEIGCYLLVDSVDNYFIQTLAILERFYQYRLIANASLSTLLTELKSKWKPKISLRSDAHPLLSSHPSNATKAVANRAPESQTHDGNSLLPPAIFVASGLLLGVLVIDATVGRRFVFNRASGYIDKFLNLIQSIDDIPFRPDYQFIVKNLIKGTKHIPFGGRLIYGYFLTAATVSFIAFASDLIPFNKNTPPQSTKPPLPVKPNTSPQAPNTTQPNASISPSTLTPQTQSSSKVWPDKNVESISKNTLKVIHRGSLSKVYTLTRNSEGVIFKGYNTMRLSPQQLQQVKLEGEILKRLNHPNIVKFVGLACTSTRVGFLLETLPMNLVELYENRLLSALEKKKILSGICSGAHYLHSQTPQILHRDIRASNVLITDADEAKLTDFGLSRKLAQAATEHCSVVEHSPNWSAPECWEDRTSIQTDVYAIGMTLLEMAIRGKPFGDDSPFTIHKKVVVEYQLPSLPADDPFTAIYAKCCARNASERYQTAEEVLEVLGKI